MTSLDRVSAVLEGRLPDRVPVALHNYLMACRMNGLGFDQMARSGEAMAEAQLAAWRKFRHDMIMHEIGVCAEAEAMGARIHYQPHQPPHVLEPLITRPQDIEKLRVPDPETTYPLNELLKGTRILVRETRGQVHINGRADQGPVALALALCGPEQFLVMLMEPEQEPWVNHLLDLCCQMNLALGLAQRRAGAHSSTIGVVGTSLISPALFDKYEAPRAAVFCHTLKAEGCYGFVHACSDETRLLKNLIATGAAALELAPPTDPHVCKQATYGKTAVLGMLDPVHILKNGLRHEVRAHAREMLRIMSPGGGFLIGPGCALPPDTKEENIHELMECVREDAA
jgi:uroporphyrinogen decarboxylase